MCNTDDKHTDIGHIVIHSPHSVRVITADSSTQMLIIQIQPHSSQITHKKKNNVYFVQKADRPLPPSDDRYVTALARACQNQIKMYRFFFWDGLILCVTLYTTKPCVFLQTRRSFLSVSYSKTDTNNKYL